MQYDQRSDNDTHSLAVGYILWIFGFLGAHRFYFGKPVSGTIYFFTLGLLFTGTLQQVLLCTSFVLQLMGTLAVASLLRTPRHPNDFPSPFRPWLQWAYIVFSVGVLVFIATDKPVESFVGLGIMLVGGLTYFVGKKTQSN